jgi:hypothetical protein
MGCINVQTNSDHKRYEKGTKFRKRHPIKFSQLGYLTPTSTVLIKKRIVFRVTQNPSIHYRGHNSQPLHANCHSVAHQHPLVHYLSIYSSIYPTFSVPYCCSFIRTLCDTCPACLSLFCLITLITFEERYNILNPSLSSFLQTHATCLLPPNEFI